ncbi:short-chain dehydrogenase/reductase SDR [Candidatus Protofrankia californiensis]|uniref:Short-chain dehydrogenase/reductase SDR n=1 Tax=Candidatus Protofrankia californiensis TaxID=1839754 RepID=A0A1C3NXG6_9ACTN|nr:short-chain dehydrogenase/reductase SDR [Candidatus Protofrankia californiensis]
MRILITGTRSGVGQSLATQLLQRGYEVVGCSRKPASIEHGSYCHYEVDLTDASQVRDLFTDVRRRFRHLDGLINNAGVSSMNHFMMTPEAVARHIFDVNFFSVLNCCREATKLLQRSAEPAPSILNVSSVAVPWALDGQLAYSASKGAVEQMTRVMSKELAALGIRVNTIGLPPVRTVLTRTVPKEKIDNLIKRQSIERMCSMEDILGPVEFLITSQSAFVTGETLFLGGVN